MLGARTRWGKDHWTIITRDVAESTRYHLTAILKNTFGNLNSAKIDRLNHAIDSVRFNVIRIVHMINNCTVFVHIGTLIYIYECFTLYKSEQLNAILRMTPWPLSNEHLLQLFLSNQKLFILCELSKFFIFTSTIRSDMPSYRDVMNRYFSFLPSFSLFSLLLVVCLSAELEQSCSVQDEQWNVGYPNTLVDRLLVQICNSSIIQSSRRGVIFIVWNVQNFT